MRHTKEAPSLVEGLGRRGVVFDRDMDEAVSPFYLNGDKKSEDVIKAGNIALRYFGGQKKMRTAYAKSGIGKQLVSGISAELRRYEAEGKVRSLTNRRFIAPVLHENRCIGSVFQKDDGAFETIKADALIAASGGMGGLFDRQKDEGNNDENI